MAGADDVEPAEPRRPEATATVLARLEGKVDLANYKLDDQARRMQGAETRLTQHDEAIASLRSDLRSHIESEAAAVVAVKAAKDEEIRQAERRWSPRARFWTTASSVAFVISAILAAAQYLHH